MKLQLILVLSILTIFVSCEKEEELAQKISDQDRDALVTCAEDDQLSLEMSLAELLIILDNNREESCVALEDEIIHTGSEPCIRCKKVLIDPEEKLCPEIYEPVCGGPPIPECIKDANGLVVCPAIAYIETTYSNRCELEKAKASFVHEGECRGDIAPIPPKPEPKPLPPEKPPIEEIQCLQVYKPVCGGPAIPDCIKDDNGLIACPAIAYIETTYSNMCELEKAKATFIHEGECVGDRGPIAVE